MGNQDSKKDLALIMSMQDTNFQIIYWYSIFILQPEIYINHACGLYFTEFLGTQDVIMTSQQCMKKLYEDLLGLIAMAAVN